MKQRIRELYKRVHPDLFHDQHEAREANGRSLQLLQVLPAAGPVLLAKWPGELLLLLFIDPRPAELQEYLDSAQRGGEIGRTAGVPFNFSFYLHRESTAEENASSGMRLTAARTVATTVASALRKLFRKYCPNMMMVTIYIP